MRAVWLRVRAGMRQDWRGPVALALITGLLGSAVLVALAGARRTDTAVSRFVTYSGPTEGEVLAGPRATDTIAALPGVAYTARSALMLAFPARADGRAAVPLGQVLTWAVIYRPAQARVITVAGRLAAPSRANEVVINETAARILTARVGSVIRLRGYRPDQVHQVLNGASPPPSVWLPSVHVVGVIRTPVDLTENPDAPADVSFMGTGSLYVTAAFYHRFASSVGNMAGLAFHLKGGFRDLAAFEAEVRRVTGAQVLAGSDAHDGAVDGRHRGPEHRTAGVYHLRRLPGAAGAGRLSQAALRGRARPRGAGRGGRDGIGGPDRLRAFRIHAGRTGTPGGDLARTLVQCRDPVERCRRARAAACRQSGDYGVSRDEGPHGYIGGASRTPRFTGGPMDGSQRVPANSGVRYPPRVRAGPRPLGCPGSLDHPRNGGGARRGDGSSCVWVQPGQRRQ